MRKILTTAVTALTALSVVATAVPALARDHDRDDDDQGEWRHNDHHDRGWHNGWRDRRGHHWVYYGGRYGYDGYDGRWRVGERFPYYDDDDYVVEDYAYYGLPAPRRGYRYYRDRNGDIILAAIAGGVIGLIIGSAGR